MVRRGRGGDVIIDCHCHAGQGDGLTGPWDTAAPLAKYVARARQAGIRRTVLFAAFHSDYAVANAGVARIVRRHADRFLGFAFIHAARDRGRVAALIDTAVGEWGFCGIKVHRHDAPISREICEAAAHFRIPVLYDVVGDVASIELFAAEYPHVDFIIPHLGSFGDDWRAQHAIADALVRHANVYTDTSGVRRYDLLVEAVRRAGAHKVLFGSDGPWLHPGLELHKIRLLALPQADEAAICGGNLLRLLAKRTTAAALNGRSPAGARAASARAPRGAAAVLGR